MKNPEPHSALTWRDVVRARGILAGLRKRPLSSSSIPVSAFCVLISGDLMQLRASGWSWKDLSGVLRKNGIAVSERELSRFLSDARCDVSALLGVMEIHVEQGDDALEKALAAWKTSRVVTCLTALAPDLTKQQIRTMKKGELRRSLMERIRELTGRGSIPVAKPPQASAEGGEHRQQFDIDLGMGGKR